MIVWRRNRNREKEKEGWCRRGGGNPNFGKGGEVIERGEDLRKGDEREREGNPEKH